MVKVLVGKDRKVYTFHKTLLTSRCPFFEKCLAEDSLSEGNTNEMVFEDDDTVLKNDDVVFENDDVVLENDDVDTFNHFFRWIYLGKIESQLTIPLGRLYALADRFCMESFKNALVDTAMISCRKLPVPMHDLNLLVKQGLVDSQLATFFLEQLAYEMKMQECDLEAEDEDEQAQFSELLSNTEAMVEFLRTLGTHYFLHGRDEISSPAEGRACAFHEHRLTASCEPVPKKLRMSILILNNCLRMKAHGITYIRRRALFKRDLCQCFGSANITKPSGKFARWEDDEAEMSPIHSHSKGRLSSGCSS